MSRLFISHSSRNDDWAIALRDWLLREGWSGENDVFLDLDPERGIVPGQRWQNAFAEAVTRCEAVLFLISEDWLASRWCHDEYQLANKENKPLFALLIEDIELARLPGGLAAQWQVVRLKGEPAERFIVMHPYTQQQWPVHIVKAGLASLKSGLQKAGIGPETFELQPNSNGPFGWRSPYRGLEALESADAAVFFGRNADMVRGMDELRRLAAHKPPRLLVILGASGAGKSSFLRAGLYPRLMRDDSKWLPLKVIRASRGGAIEGSEGLLSALEQLLHHRFALQISRADLRGHLATPKYFIEFLRRLRQAAAQRALLSDPPYPLPVMCFDQAEEIFVANASPECEMLLALARAAVDADEALLLVTIRSDAYDRMQAATALTGIDQVPLSLGPVPHGELARIIREPSEVLRRKAGSSAPMFDAAVVERLQEEIAGEADALPLLAFVLQRLMREHLGVRSIGLRELARTGGIAEAIESAAEASFADAGYPPDLARRREILRRLFIPRLARINRETKTAQRRVASQSGIPADLLPLAKALTERRLLVAKGGGDPGDDNGTGTTLEVAHEALLRRWPMLATLLGEDRDDLLLLDGVLSAATDWDEAKGARKTDFLAHRGSRLAQLRILAARGADWAREIAPAQSYLAACSKADSAARRRAQSMLGAVGVLMLGTIVSLLGVIFKDDIGDLWVEQITLRRYVANNVTPHVLSPERERGLKPRTTFRECAKDCPEMVVVPAGEFLMGSPDGEGSGSERPRHKVKINKPFAVGKFEVTWDDWKACVDVRGCDESGTSDSNFGRERHPLINVSWNQAKAYVAWLSRVTGKPYRLLSEAEWQYAARGLITTDAPYPPYPWGSKASHEYANYGIDQCCNGKTEGRDKWFYTAPVGQFPPNAFGLYDMHGNVAEWVEDPWHDNYRGIPPTDGSVWLEGGNATFRVVCGGSWADPPVDLRSATRRNISAYNRNIYTGFRIARTLIAP